MPTAEMHNEALTIWSNLGHREAALVSQVHIVEFHPVQPWIGLADKSSNVAVWDYRSSQVR